MADKTTTLKTKTNDNVYPNIIGDNRDNAISDSAHIKHTLTKEHKINFRLDSNVSNLIFNSLQNPKGLTKTELVGVGTNGQENIEIGDNLTLSNGKLSATGGGKIVIKQYNVYTKDIFSIPVKTYEKNKVYSLEYKMYPSDLNVTKILGVLNITVGTFAGLNGIMLINDVVFITQVRTYIFPDCASLELYYTPLETVTITEQPELQITTQFICEK